MKQFLSIKCPLVVEFSLEVVGITLLFAVLLKGKYVRYSFYEGVYQDIPEYEFHELDWECRSIARN